MTVSEVAIRPAQPEDASRLHELHTASVRTLCSGHYPADIIDAWLGNRTPSGYLDAIERGGLFVAERDGRVVGFGEGAPGTVVAVYVDPANVLQGVGKFAYREGRLAMEIKSTQALCVQENIVELDRLGDEIAELSAHLDAATAHLLDLIREFDARGGWNTGFRTCGAWLSWRVGLDPGAARERVRVRGEISFSKLRAVTRGATPATQEELLAGAGWHGRACRAHRARLAIRRPEGRGA
ncbi:MAG: hypothetical protein DMD81_27140 [Candidatus Rokuibacteriota bacterium]|nr:MAG: hypothetical protein DMD81_27140 [Candidatus Rokubacteria bacterium]